MMLRMMGTPVFAIAIALAGVPQKQVQRAGTLGQKVREAQLDFEKGIQYADGAGVAKDMQKAAEQYRKAAEKGHIPAQYNLAYLLENGAGIEQNLKEAAGWYRKAAEQGDAQSQNNLGVMYATGSGVAKDDAEAVRWYSLAAQQKDAQGLTNLAAMYLQGRGVQRDYARALDLSKQAAESGYPVAQNNLALMYANGQGVKQDYVMAYAWLDVAAVEVRAAASLRDKMATRMTPAQVGQAKEIAAMKIKKFRGGK